MKLQDIKDPSFLKQLSILELEQLSEDIRTFLLEQMAQNGGHLSSNLGVVELTVALHKVFNSPTDQIIFDVGHQAYTHKILTGRAKQFSTLRKYQGISGFQKRNESIHDVYEAGHSSTSLSAAFGFAVARDIDQKDHHVIAVIGDGSIGNGLAYEAMNHIGATDTNLLVILNDNEMSISKNVGAVHNVLDQIRVNRSYLKAKVDTRHILRKLPFIGTLIISLLEKMKSAFKRIYVKKGTIFEDLGFEYFGPIDGHDYKELLTYLEMVKRVKGPVLLHVITEKGKGYSYAEQDQTGVWHGVSPFDIKTGKMNHKPKKDESWSNVIATHLVELKKQIHELMVISPAMISGSKLHTFAETYPDSVFDVGIAEEHALVFANTLALSGKRPFVSIYSTFLQRGYDQVSHDIARMNSPVVIGIDRASLIPDDGETHQGIYDVSYLSHIPNMVIMAPKDSVEAGNMLYTAFTGTSPVAIRYPRGETSYQRQLYQPLPIGSWEKIESGKDILIITYGNFIDNAKQIKELLAPFSISTEIINARFIKPMDDTYLKKLFKRHTRIYVYEESTAIGSLGQMVSAYAIKQNYKGKITCLGLPDQFIEHGSKHDILHQFDLDYETVAYQIKKDMKKES